MSEAMEAQGDRESAFETIAHDILAAWGGSPPTILTEAVAEALKNTALFWCGKGYDQALEVVTTNIEHARTGDVVFHRPSGERWTVAAAWPERNDLAWCGWPDGIARLTDCVLLKRCTDEEHWQLVERIAASAEGRRQRYAANLLEARAKELAAKSPLPTGLRDSIDQNFPDD
jgi:hypothetical protein